jgi:hypothetical protein
VAKLTTRFILPIVAATQTIGDKIFATQNCAEDIARVRAEGFEVDNDNDPAPENVPGFFDVPLVVNGGLFEEQSWGWDGIDRRQTAGGGYDEPSFPHGFTLIGKTYLQLFMHFFPMAWFSAVLLPQTSAGVVDTGTTPVTFGELLQFLGICLLMSTCSGWNVDEFWNYDTVPRDQEEDPCPYNFRTFMSKRCFQCIIRYLKFTNIQRLAFVDKFWSVRQMIKSWNDHMAGISLCAWVICLDESMSIWPNKWTCPGWVICPRKPHPFGNEYHTACCALSTIMFVIELVKGKDAPPPDLEAILATQEDCRTATPHAAVVFPHCKIHRSRLWLLCAQGHHRAAQEWFVWLRANQKTEVLACWRTGGRDATIL